MHGSNMGKYNPKYDDPIEIEELIPDGWEELYDTAINWDDLEELNKKKEKEDEKRKDFCKCGSDCKPKEMVISKALKWWTCEKCKKECDNPKINDLRNTDNGDSPF